MSKNKEQSQEEKSIIALKEVHQKVAEDPKSGSPDKYQSSAEEAADQIKGSDADVDHSVGFDDQPAHEETREQIKDTNADPSE